MSATETLPPTAPGGTSPKLIHVWFVDIPQRTLCGQSRDLSDAGMPYGEQPVLADNCVVCEALADDYVYGRWQP